MKMIRNLALTLLAVAVTRILKKRSPRGEDTDGPTVP
jgi:hypothetical protein